MAAEKITTDIASNGKPRDHRGDTMSSETRSRVMQHIKGKGTGPERLLAKELRKAGLRWSAHDSTLPGRPDFVFKKARVVVFVDGDFWHGWRFPAWCHKLSPEWEAKILKNRARDRRNHQKIRRQKWKVVRIWEHQLSKNPTYYVEKLLKTISSNCPPSG